MFEVFQNWLYGNGLELDADQAKDTSLTLALCIFGDKVQVPVFQNATMEALKIRSNDPFPIMSRDDIQLVFDNNGEQSPLRKFIIDFYVWEASIVGVVNRMLEEAAYPKAFVLGVIEGYITYFPRPDRKAIKNKKPYATSVKGYYVPQQVGLSG